MKPGAQSLLLVHLSAILLGFLGPTLKVIPASSASIVFGRSLIQCLGLALMVWIAGRSLRLRSWSDFRIVFLLGILQAFQWWTFIFAIQVSTVAIALISTFSFPVWLALFEPVFFRERFRIRNLLTGATVILGLFLIAPGELGFSLPAERWYGLLSGTASGILVAIVMLVTRKAVREISSVTINFYESLITALLFSVFAVSMSLGAMDWARLGYIALFFSGLPYLLITFSMRHLEARRVGMIVSLEPMYGILLAAALLSEIPDLLTIIGGTLILAISILETVTRKDIADMESSFLKHPQ